MNKRCCQILKIGILTTVSEKKSIYQGASKNSFTQKKSTIQEKRGRGGVKDS
jgi:hypothetical protein